MEVIFLLVGSVVLLAGVAWFADREQKAKVKAQVRAEIEAEKAPQQALRMAQLEDRVRVLERIVTDRGYDVATQIEALRDQRRVEDRVCEPAATQPIN